MLTAAMPHLSLSRKAVHQALGELMVDAVPAHLRTVTPRLVCKDAKAAIAFYQKAFGAEQLGEVFTMPDGKIVHAELRIGDSVIFVTDENEDGNGTSPGVLGGVSVLIALSVPDADAWWARAMDAGASVVYPIEDQFYGDRGGRVADPFGHQWMISTHIEDVDPEELDRRMKEFMS